MKTLLDRISSRPLRGFTLVEMVISAALLLILASLVLPAAKQTLTAADRVRCQSNLRQIAVALSQYTAEHNGYLPVAAPQELGGLQGKVPADDPWLPARMFGGSLPADQRPLNAYLDDPKVFRSPCDRGEPLWWFDTAAYQKTATCFELYGSSYFYASGYNRMGGVLAPMGLAKFVGPEFSYGDYARQPLPLGRALMVSSYPQASKKVVVGSIPIHRTMSGVVAASPRARWYRKDPEHLWANAAFLDGHVEFVRVFPYDRDYAGVGTVPDEDNPYY